MRIAVTGGDGFIGSYVVEKLRSLGDIVLVIDKKRGVDIRDYKKINNLFNMFNPEVIVHLAAVPLIKECNDDPVTASEIIIQGTTNLLTSIINRKNFKRFVFISSSMTYGDFEQDNIQETHPQNPKEIYGCCKLASELLVRTFNEKFGIEYTIIRPSAVYGPRDVNRRVSQILIEQAMNGKTLTVNDGYNTKLDFTYVEDISDGIVLSTSHVNAKNETFNMTYGNGRSLMEYAEIVKKYYPSCEIENRPPDRLHPKRGGMSIKKAKALLGYDPKYNLELGIERYINWVKSKNE